MVSNEAIGELVQALQPEPTDQDTTYEAVVSRVDEEGVVWVRLAGSDKETPTASTSAEVKRDDLVNVEWRNNKLYIAGNYSNPSAGAIRVDAVERAATVAREAAQSAVADAQIAREAAESVEGIAIRAEEYATEAKASAENASEYAARALGNLSTVQSVTETLNWITSHGTMTLTSDTALDPTHVYFVVDQNGDYEVGGTHYSVVTEPDVADISTYYELSIDESLNNYVGTHLAVTSEGLWLLPDADGNKVLIATGQGTTYTEAGTYIVDTVNGEDVILAHFTANGVQIGSEAATSMVTMSSSGFKIEDDNLLNVCEIGKGITLVNHFVYELTSFGDATVGNDSLIGRFEKKYTNPKSHYIDLVNPIGTIKLSIPWKKRSPISIDNITDSGVADYQFTAGTASTQYDDTGTLQAVYDGDSRINVKLLDGSDYRTWVYRNSPQRTLTKGSRVALGGEFHTELSYGTTGHCNVRFALHFNENDSTIYRLATFNNISLDTAGTTAYNFSVNDYSFVARCIRTKISATDYKITFDVQRTGGSDAVYATAETWMNFLYDALQLDGAPVLDYYGTAEGPYYSFGQRTGTSKGSYSFISGQGLTAEYPRETVLGMYNNDSGDYALTIGNGTDENTRSNAFAVTWDGNAHIDLADYQTADTTDKAIYDALVALGWESEVTE